MRGRWRWYTLALALFALALMAKTVVVTLPFVLLVIYWWKRGTIHARDVLRLAPFFALSVAMGFVTMLMETHYVGVRGDEWSLSPVARLLLAGRALWFYAGKLAWPHPIVFFYPRWEIDAHVWWQYLFPAAAVLVPVGLWLLRGRIGRGPLAAVLVFAGVLVPALGFFNVYYMRYAYVLGPFSIPRQPGPRRPSVRRRRDRRRAAGTPLEHRGEDRSRRFARRNGSSYRQPDIHLLGH